MVFVFDDGMSLSAPAFLVIVYDPESPLLAKLPVNWGTAASRYGGLTPPYFEVDCKIG